MSLILRGIALLIGLIVSAQAKLHAVIFGQPVAVPVLWLLVAVVLLVLAALVLCLVLRILQERQQPGPQPVYVVTTLT